MAAEGGQLLLDNVYLLLVDKNLLGWQILEWEDEPPVEVAITIERSIHRKAKIIWF